MVMKTLGPVSPAHRNHIPSWPAMLLESPVCSPRSQHKPCFDFDPLQASETKTAQFRTFQLRTHDKPFRAPTTIHAIRPSRYAADRPPLSPRGTLEQQSVIRRPTTQNKQIDALKLMLQRRDLAVPEIPEVSGQESMRVKSIVAKQQTRSVKRLYTMTDMGENSLQEASHRNEILDEIESVVKLTKNIKFTREQVEQSHIKLILEARPRNVTTNALKCLSGRSRQRFRICQFQKHSLKETTPSIQSSMDIKCEQIPLTKQLDYFVKKAGQQQVNSVQIPKISVVMKKTGTALR